MTRLVEAALRHRVVVFAAAVLLVLAGLRAVSQLPVDAFPDVTNVQVTVISHGPTLSPLEMASAYGTFANHGVRAEPVSILRVTDPDGSVLIDNTNQVSERVLSAAVAKSIRIS